MQPPPPLPVPPFFPESQSQVLALGLGPSLLSGTSSLFTFPSCFAFSTFLPAPAAHLQDAAFFQIAAINPQIGHYKENWVTILLL